MMQAASQGVLSSQPPQPIADAYACRDMSQSTTLKRAPTIRTVPNLERAGASDGPGANESRSPARRGRRTSSSSSGGGSRSGSRSSDSDSDTDRRRSRDDSSYGNDNARPRLRPADERPLGTINGHGAGTTMAPNTTTTTAPPSSSSSAASASATTAMGQPRPAVEDAAALSAAVDSHPAGAWDSTIGKAGLGKTGRVINRLVDENETLKREIRTERLRAEEARQTARLTEEKLERSMAEYESRLLEASVNKTLLTRKERQVETLSATVEQERGRAAAAVERERSWRDELDRARDGAASEVRRAQEQVMLTDGRYGALVSSRAGQQAEVARLRAEARAVAAERVRDDERIATLAELCAQQDVNVRTLLAQNRALHEQHELYKQAQEDGLRRIKAEAARRESEQEAMLAEAREVLHKLKWALNAKQNVREAE